MSNTDPGFKMREPLPPKSPAVREFFADNPDFDTQQSLEFLTSEYPDTDSWVVDSGVAVQLLTGKREEIPRDLDIVSRDDAMEDDFGHTHGLDPNDNRYIDVKSIGHWLRGRVQDVDTQDVWQSILDTSLTVDLNGKPVKIMHPAIIAAAKSTLAKMSVRPKDVSDVAVLGVTTEQLKAAVALLQNINPQEQINILNGAK